MTLTLTALLGEDVTAVRLGTLELAASRLLEALRSDEEMKHVPIVILTGTESAELRTRALNLGATDFLMKPVDVDELLPRVRNMLTIKLHQDSLERLIGRVMRHGCSFART